MPVDADGVVTGWSPGATAMYGYAQDEIIGRPLADLFARAARGDLRAVVGATYPLADAAQAHTDMQARRTTGKLLLDPTAA